MRKNVQVTDGRVTFDGDEQMIARANIGCHHRRTGTAGIGTV